MKNLTFVLFALILVSCSNKKAEIVELMKSYKDSSTVVSRSILQLTINDTQKYKELFSTNGDVDLKKLQNSKITKEYQDYHNKIEDEKGRLKSKTARFENIIDSLELELKKY
jgi:DNA gyrase/topoisomerase IV subunit A